MPPTATLTEVPPDAETEDETGNGAVAPESPPEPEGPEAETTPDDEITLTVEGDRQLSLAIGGSKPEKSTIKLTGGAFEVRGEFAKGARARFVVEGPISEVGAVDLMDRQTGTVTGTVRKHVLKIDSVERVD